MKTIRNIIFLFLISLFINCSNNNKKNSIIEYIVYNDSKIPKLNLDMAPDSAKNISLSSLIEKIKIIPLETKNNCLIGSIGEIHLSENYILIASGLNLYQFDLEGKFLHEIGGVGKGPGEHSRNYNHLIISEEDQHIMLSYQLKDSHLFDFNGNFIKTIPTYYKSPDNIAKLNKNIYVGAHSISSEITRVRDTVSLYFFDSKGKILNYFPRTTYPPPKPGYVWKGKISFYKYSDDLHYYAGGNDTLYNVTMDKLTPIAILSMVNKGIPYNKIIKDEEVEGKSEINSILEYDEYWIFEKTEMEEFEHIDRITFYSPKDQILIIDKKSGQAHNINVIDDIFGLLTMNERMKSQRLLFEKDYLIQAFPAIDLKEKIAQILKSPEDLSDASIIRLKELNSQITDNSNPVLFYCPMRKVIDID